MHFQGYTPSAQETLEMITEITHWYFAFSYNFVCLEVMGLKVRHYSAFASATVPLSCSIITVSTQRSTELQVPASVTAFEKHEYPTTHASLE